MFYGGWKPYVPVAERRANPGNDLISQLTKAQVDGQPITDEALAPMIFLLLVGGLDTVASAMGFAARFLATSPAVRPLARCFCLSWRHSRHRT